MFRIMKPATLKFVHSIAISFGYALHNMLLNEESKKVGAWKVLLGSFWYSVPMEAMEARASPYEIGRERHS